AAGGAVWRPYTAWAHGTAGRGEAARLAPGRCGRTGPAGTGDRPTPRYDRGTHSDSCRSRCAIPFRLVAAKLLLDPASAIRMAGGAVRAYSLNAASVSHLRAYGGGG